MKKILFLLLAVCGLAACDKGGDDTPKNITITGGGTNQTIYADETSINKGEGIKFSTTGAWRTEIEEVTRAVSWIELSQTSGDKAGDYTLQITLSQNTSGKDRKATIKIICGDTVITITVEQKGTTEDGNVPEDPDVPMVDRLITKMESIDDRTEGIRGDERMDFYYDSKNRVNKMVVTKTETNEATTTWISTCIITYADNKVTYQVTGTENGVEDKSAKYSGEIALDGNGRAISGKGTYVDEKDHLREESFTYMLTYNTEGYLTKSEITDTDFEGASRTTKEYMTWTNGNMTQVLWAYIGGSSGELIDKAVYGTVLNKTNLDLNWFIGLTKSEGFAFATGDAMNIFSALGYTGERCENLVEYISEGTGNGMTRESDKYEYVTDKEGYPTSIKTFYKNTGKNTWEKSRDYTITYNF